MGLALLSILAFRRLLKAGRGRRQRPIEHFSYTATSTNEVVAFQHDVENRHRASASFAVIAVEVHTQG